LVFIAAKIAVELIETLRYKLCMFGIPIKGAANMYCDNNSVVTNTSYPESKLNKKHNAIAYHKVREAVAAAGDSMSWKGRFQNKHCRYADKSLAWS
jgi:hypothetical protein